MVVKDRDVESRELAASCCGVDLAENRIMPIYTLKFLIDLPRQGNLLANDVLPDVDKLAASVPHVAGEAYFAPTAASAVAWLGLPLTRK